MSWPSNSQYRMYVCVCIKYKLHPMWDEGRTPFLQGKKEIEVVFLP